MFTKLFTDYRYPIYTETWGIRLVWSSPCTGDTRICCRAVGSVAATTCFNDLDLSRMGFEHPTFRMLGDYKRLHNSSGSAKGVSVTGPWR